MNQLNSTIPILNPDIQLSNVYSHSFVFKATKSNMRISVKAVGSDDRYGTRNIVHEIPYHDDKVLQIYLTYRTNQIFTIFKFL